MKTELSATLAMCLLTVGLAGCSSSPQASDSIPGIQGDDALMLPQATGRTAVTAADHAIETLSVEMRGARWAPTKVTIRNGDAVEVSSRGRLPGEAFTTEFRLQEAHRQ